ncbi:Copine_I [Hexamita inflata]|uniref:Copine I n=1 Tax=Hexamita inflata TaxID=28002 RepID=A0AA86NAF9_9EUKA|nr:Copine I [Hexamita inflata]
MGANKSTPAIIPQTQPGYGNTQSTQQILRDKYKTYAELEQALRQSGLESMQLIVGFDFSKSNEWTGEKTYHKSLHGADYLNPYLHSLQVLEPIIPKFDDDGIIPAFRFGCADTRDAAVCPLLAPQVADPHFKGFEELKKAYYAAVQQVRLSGPTTFAPMIRQAIEIEKAYGGRQLLFLLLLTDGDVSNLQLDRQTIVEASQYPISICAMGLGDGPFDKMIEFDDMPGRKFDNFQFVDFTQLEAQSAKCECPDLVLATAVFNELPEQFKAMRAGGMI